jgi:catechol 2,3-dioxygenase-like lactoylglutathione lyase family enzyme
MTMTSVNYQELATRTARLPSLRIAELVLQTSRLDELKRWYAAVLGRPWSVENEPRAATVIDGEHGDGGKQVHASRVRSAFMIMDADAPAMPYGQLFALFQLDGIGTAPTGDPGLNHMQFKHRSLQELIERVELLGEAGIVPHRCANHGPITSFYFRDPDQNVVELCCNNFPTFEEWIAYFGSPQFKRNPSGIDLNAQDFVRDFRGGKSLAELLRIPA